jgi:hypothetical protein
MSEWTLGQQIKICCQKNFVYPILSEQADQTFFWIGSCTKVIQGWIAAKEMIPTEESNTVLDLESPPLKKNIGVAISVEEIAQQQQQQQQAYTKFISFACPVPYDESIVVPPANNNDDDWLLDNPQLVTRLPIQQPPACMVVNSYGEMVIGIVGTITMLGRTTAMIWWSWGRIMVPPVSTPNLSNDTESTITTTTTTTNSSGTGTFCNSFRIFYY